MTRGEERPDGYRLEPIRRELARQLGRPVEMFLISGPEEQLMLDLLLEALSCGLCVYRRDEAEDPLGTYEEA